MGTMWGGSLSFKTPMLFSLGFVSMFVIGGISGVMHAIAPSDAQQQDTYFIVAHIHYVLFGGAIFAIMAGIYYWFPKITGRMYDEKQGQVHFWLMFAGQNITFFPMHFTGLDGMPRRIYTYYGGMGWDFWNIVSTAGAFVLAFGLLVFIYNMYRSWSKGEAAGSDPWDARTIEWSIPSPPPEYNFAVIPHIEDRDDWWEEKQRGRERRREAVPVVAGASDENGHDIHLPQPSYWPFFVSLGLFIGGMAMIYLMNVDPATGARTVNWTALVISAAGFFLGIVSVYRWSFEPVNDPEPEGGGGHH